MATSAGSEQALFPRSADEVSRSQDLQVDELEELADEHVDQMIEESDNDWQSAVENEVEDEEEEPILPATTRRSQSVPGSPLVSIIMEKAQGVFLWVRLAMDELIRARIDGASLAELNEIILTLPDELEQFYERIITRLLRRYRLESFVMLEVLVRTAGFERRILNEHHPLTFQNGHSFLAKLFFCGYVQDVGQDQG